MTAPDAFSCAMQIAAALERADLPYAIGDALALGIWAVPRGTYVRGEDDPRVRRWDELVTAFGRPG